MIVFTVVSRKLHAEIIIIVQCIELYHRSFVRNQQLQLIPLAKFNDVSAIVRVLQLHLARSKASFLLNN